MSERYRDQSWSIAPDTWPVRADEDCVTLDGPAGDAAVQISAYRKRSGEVTLDELLEFATTNGHGQRPAATQVGDFRGFGVRYEDRGLQWRCWWLGSESLHLFITHTADNVEALKATEAAVDRILRSLQLESTSPAV